MGTDSARRKALRRQLAKGVGHAAHFKGSGFLKVFALKMELGPGPSVQARGMQYGRAVQRGGELRVALRKRRRVYKRGKVGIHSANLEPNLR